MRPRMSKASCKGCTPGKATLCLLEAANRTAGATAIERHGQFWRLQLWKDGFAREEVCDRSSEGGRSAGGTKVVYVYGTLLALRVCGAGPRVKRLPGGQVASRGRFVYVNVGANKGYNIAEFLRHFKPSRGVWPAIGLKASRALRSMSAPRLLRATRDAARARSASRRTRPDGRNATMTSPSAAAATCGCCAI